MVKMIVRINNKLLKIEKKCVWYFDTDKKVNYRMPLTMRWRSRINVTIQVHIFFVTITIHAGTCMY